VSQSQFLGEQLQRSVALQGMRFSEPEVLGRPLQRIEVAGAGDEHTFGLGPPAGHLEQPPGQRVQTLPGPCRDPQAVARREFAEETGHEAPDGTMLELGEILQKGGKTVVAWGLVGELDPAAARSNTFEMEWPPRSGRRRAFPEIDRVEWFDLEAARTKILPAQIPLLDRLEEALHPT